MDSHEPVVLQTERNGNRQTCIILAIISSAFCVLALLFGWLARPLIDELYTAVLAEVFPAATQDIRPTNVPISIAPATLSGTWTGTETLTAVGSCKLEQGNSVTNPVKMVWQVNDQGEVVVILPNWPGVYPYTFEGNVQPDLSFSLDFSSSARCGGNESPYSATYESTMQAEGDTLKLDMESTEVWCPGTCVFLRHYSVHKTAGP
jgi:hypothetical protein